MQSEASISHVLFIGEVLAIEALKDKLEEERLKAFNEEESTNARRELIECAHRARNRAFAREDLLNPKKFKVVKEFKVEVERDLSPRSKQILDENGFFHFDWKQFEPSNVSFCEKYDQAVSDVNLGKIERYSREDFQRVMEGRYPWQGYESNFGFTYMNLLAEALDQVNQTLSESQREELYFLVGKESRFPFKMFLRGRLKKVRRGFALANYSTLGGGMKPEDNRSPRKAILRELKEEGGIELEERVLSLEYQTSLREKEIFQRIPLYGTSTDFVVGKGKYRANKVLIICIEETDLQQ